MTVMTTSLTPQHTISSYCALVDNEAVSGSGGGYVRNDRQALAYVADYILQKKGVTPDTNCSDCKTTLFSPTPTENHLFTSFKEYDALNPKLLYASDSLMSFVVNVHSQLYACLDKCEDQEQLETTFYSLFTFPEEITFCKSHFSEQYILRQCVPLLLYKYVKDWKHTISNKRLDIVKNKFSKRFKAL
ncbi:uncharacterized protein LOC126147067 [Schistocerca cancellata]|uniref:uncharacterized protein LOC126147067 n=1 Tax=Schistocerca cancellata TaxID=274614 RepID=UPI002118EB78|nr:uncharacterized protein LOC126147067 [Schistocerca cancellata]